MSSKKSLVTTKDKIVKEWNDEMRIKPNVVQVAITPFIAKNNIYTVKITEKQQASKRKKINSSAINKTKVNNWMNQGLIKELKQKTQ